jgi:hypothetical protein
MRDNRPQPKPRLTMITDRVELAELLRHNGELGYPQLQADNTFEFWADADELKAWRLQHTSDGEQR